MPEQRLHRSIYYLTGMRGSLTQGLGAELARRGLTVTGRELVGGFRQLSFRDQVEAVAADLLADHWCDEARVIANSFGAYLLLHAQAQLPPYPGRVLLLSPIVGEFSSDEVAMGFIPPRSQQLAQHIASGSYPALSTCEIHVGDQDWQSNPDAVAEFAEATNASFYIVKGAGHSLPKEYVGEVLDAWMRRHG